MTLLFCTSASAHRAPYRRLESPSGKRDITHLRLFFPLPSSRFLAAPDVTCEAQTVWPSHRDLHSDTERRVGVFVFYSQCKSHRAYQRGGGRGWDGSTCAAVLSPSRLRRINHSQILPLPPPPPRCCHCQIRRPRLTKLFLDFAENRESFFIFIYLFFASLT